jgi:hypothetical protein
MASMTCRRCHGTAHHLDNDPEIPSIVCMTCGERTYQPDRPHVVKVEGRGEKLWCRKCQENPRMANREQCHKCWRKILKDRRERVQAQEVTA